MFPAIIFKHRNRCKNDFDLTGTLKETLAHRLGVTVVCANTLRGESNTDLMHGKHLAALYVISQVRCVLKTGSGMMTS